MSSDRTRRSAIRFAVNLHEHHNVPLTHAYASAVAQFRALRSEHQVASKVALLEAEHYGIEFGPSLTERMFEEEEKALNSWQKDVQADAKEKITSNTSSCSFNLPVNQTGGGDRNH